MAPAAVVGPAEAEAERVEAETPATDADTPIEAGVGPAPLETVLAWVKLVAAMGPDELESFEERTFRQWAPESLGDVRRAIDRRRRELSR